MRTLAAGIRLSMRLVLDPPTPEFDGCPGVKLVMVVVVMKMLVVGVSWNMVLVTLCVECMLMCLILVGAGRCMGFVTSAIVVLVCMVVLVIVKFTPLESWPLTKCIGLRLLKAGLVPISIWCLVSSGGVVGVVSVVMTLIGLVTWLVFLLL